MPDEHEESEASEDRKHDEHESAPHPSPAAPPTEAIILKSSD
jgi:hypothetical protein